MTAPQRPEPVYVSQRDSWDCGVACLAMVSGRTYDAVLAGLGAQAVEGYRQNGGISTAHMPQLLGELRLATRTVFCRAEEWWTTPLTGLRLADVRGHYVVVLPDNTVLDPARGPGRAVADYANAFHLWEIHPVEPAPPPVAAREDPFCPLHGPARASDHAAAGCTCRPGDAREEPKRFHSGEQVFEHYVPGYKRPEAEPSPYAREEQGADIVEGWPGKAHGEPKPEVAPPAPSPDVAALVDEMLSCADKLSDGPGVPWARQLLRRSVAAFAAQARRTEEAERDKYCVVETVVKQERELRALQQRLADAEQERDEALRVSAVARDVAHEYQRQAEEAERDAEFWKREAMRHQANWIERGHQLADAEAKLAEAAEDPANATGGFDAATGLADAEQERAKAAEQRVRDLEAALQYLRRQAQFARDGAERLRPLSGYSGATRRRLSPCAAPGRGTVGDLRELDCEIARLVFGKQTTKVKVIEGYRYPEGHFLDESKAITDFREANAIVGEEGVSLACDMEGVRLMLVPLYSSGEQCLRVIYEMRRKGFGFALRADAPTRWNAIFWKLGSTEIYSGYDADTMAEAICRAALRSLGGPAMTDQPADPLPPEVVEHGAIPTRESACGLTLGGSTAFTLPTSGAPSMTDPTPSPAPAEPCAICNQFHGATDPGMPATGAAPETRLVPPTPPEATASDEDLVRNLAQAAAELAGSFEMAEVRLLARLRQLRAERTGPGTPLYRLTWLLDQLSQRFAVEKPFSPEGSEPKYLAAIDALATDNAQLRAEGERLREKNHQMAGERYLARHNERMLAAEIEERKQIHAEILAQVEQDHQGRMQRAREEAAREQMERDATLCHGGAEECTRTAATMFAEGRREASRAFRNKADALRDMAERIRSQPPGAAQPQEGV